MEETMGTITSSVGLVSGINSKDIIDQLMAIEAQPKSVESLCARRRRP